MSRPDRLQEALPSLWRIVRYVRPAIHRQRALIVGSFLALFAEIGLRLLEPWPLKFIFDRAIVHAHAGRALGIHAIDALDPITLISLSALAVVTITGLRALAKDLKMWLIVLSLRKSQICMLWFTILGLSDQTLVYIL